LKISESSKSLRELVGVYQDLEKTLKRLKSDSLAQPGKNVVPINVQKLIIQLAKSKRKIERKISSTLIHQRSHLVLQLDRWAPGITGNSQKKQNKNRSKPTVKH
jgi:hypothetical protein